MAGKGGFSNGRRTKSSRKSSSSNKSKTNNKKSKYKEAEVARHKNTKNKTQTAHQTATTQEKKNSKTSRERNTNNKTCNTNILHGHKRAQIGFPTVGGPKAAAKAAAKRPEGATGGQTQQKLRAKRWGSQKGGGPKFCDLFSSSCLNYTLCALSRRLFVEFR